MYTRQGCHLCEEAWQQLEVARTQWGFSLSKADVDQSPDLAELYGTCVPVVVVDGVVRFRGRVNRVLLDRLLRVYSYGHR